MRTFHYDLVVIDQAIYDAKSLGNSRPRLLKGEPIQPLQDRFDLLFC